MKHILSIILVILITISLAGCSIDDLPFLNKDTQTLSDNDEEIKYKIDKVILSKGYQSIEPKVEVIKKNNEIQLLVNVGLLETSGIQIEQVVKKGNIINIHVVNEINEEDMQLAVPQIALDLKSTKLTNLENIKFNIINENFEPISFKLGLNDAINKVKSDFNVTANTVPEANLKRIDDRFIWDITYYSIFDKDNPETPLVNLSVELDANSAQIIQSKKGFISSYIDDGHVLDYIMDKYILYLKSEIDPNTTLKTESIWRYDIKKNEKTRLYFTNLNILSACYSPDYKYISVIENNGTSNELYIISTNENKAYKVLIEDVFVPSLTRWKDKSNLFVLVNDLESTKIYNYNIKNDITELIIDSKKNIADFRIYNDIYIIVENHDTQINKNIYITTDWEDMKYIDNGFYARLINDNSIAYLKKNEKDDRNILYIYDIENDKLHDKIDLNVASISVLPENELFVVEKNQTVNDFTIYEYNQKNKELTSITKVNSDRIFYNKDKNLIYVDLVVPFEAEKSEIIYSVDLEKLVSTAP
ncbi:hypothetical protein [Tissierella sp. Yu-01]|uniref:hypothetical protein n=1 Tax=Tissierella sp. Yu-01 TaxID=3035694 RepID=UPI00240D334D|nr:hypothetical protein [Tissierella sp. Yu-01]WFA09147.1 hypothetical protein P3962_00835 [Tissierella sp. Yu-01]